MVALAYEEDAGEKKAKLEEVGRSGVQVDAKAKTQRFSKGSLIDFLFS